MHIFVYVLSHSVRTVSPPPDNSLDLAIKSMCKCVDSWACDMILGLLRNDLYKILERDLPNTRMSSKMGQGVGDWLSLGGASSPGWSAHIPPSPVGTSSRAQGDVGGLHPRAFRDCHMTPSGELSGA